MTVALIWAQAEDGVIGSAGGIPWRLPEDQAMFKQLTMDSTVLMGRLTWESLPARVQPLPGRRNLVLTSDTGWTAVGAERVGSVSEAAEMTEGDLWVIGGAAVYDAALPIADRAVVTYVDLSCDGDVHAPTLDDDWRETKAGEWRTSTTGLRYKVTTYERRSAIPSTP